MSKKRRKSGALSRRRRSIGTGTWIVLALVALVVGLIGLNLWESGIFAGAPTPALVVNPDELLPRSEVGHRLFGRHDPARVPSATPVPLPAPEGSPAPHLDLPMREYDFGRIGKSQNVTAVFAVQNTGQADLVIAGIVTSCGCTTAEISNNVIPPGRRADLAVTFDPDFHEVNGEITRVVWLATNDPALPLAEVRIMADVQR